MKLVTMGLAISLVFAGTAAFAQIGGPAHGPKAAIGGTASGRVAGASVGGPANKGTSNGASLITNSASAGAVSTKSTTTSFATTKAGPTVNAAPAVPAATPASSGAGKPKH